MNRILVHTDGGARGNPGPAAIGVVISTEGGPASGGGKKEYAEYIGETTNNEAEYRALIFALKKLKQLFGSRKLQEYEIGCYSDSELMVKQLNGEYKIKEPGIQRFFVEIWNLKIDLSVPIRFHHVPREENSGADKLVNQELDRQSSKLNLSLFINASIEAFINSCFNEAEVV